MLCPKCGSVLPNSAVRCFECGTTVVQGDPSKGEVYDAGEAKARIKARVHLDAIRTYQIISLVSSLVLVLLYLITLININRIFKQHYYRRAELETVQSSYAFLAIIIEIVLIAVGILMIVSLYNLRDSNEHFDRSFRLMIAGIILSGIQMSFQFIFEDSATDLVSIITAFSTLVDILYLYHFCKGAEELCRTKAPKVADRWSTYWSAILTIRLVTQVVALVLTMMLTRNADVFTIWKYAQIATIILTVADVIVSIFLIQTLKRTTDYLYKEYIEGKKVAN